MAVADVRDAGLRSGRGSSRAAGTNWVAITSGFAMALAVALAALGQGKVACGSLRSHGPQPCGPSGNSAGAHSWTGLHRVPGAVYPGDYFRESRKVRICL